MKGNELDLIKQSLIDFAVDHGISIEKIQDNWDRDYEDNWDADLQDRLERLIEEMELFRKAFLEKDQITQISALVIARAWALDLRNFFDDIFVDIERIAWGDEYNWPEIPEGYTIPEKYNFMGKLWLTLNDKRKEVKAINGNELELIKQSIIDFATDYGVTSEELRDGWDGDYKDNWDDEFQDLFQQLVERMELFSKAFLEKDRITQIAALVIARTSALDLMNFFDAIFEDIEKIAWGDEYNWPEIPEGYIIPEKYNFKGRL